MYVRDGDGPNFLTVVVGSSGSGKTTFLNDLYHEHKCIYIRQFHSMRPYIPVTKIPNFDPAQLPFWNTYIEEGTASTIRVGGTMAGEFTAGLSGGQRKLLLFELIYQRTANQCGLLILMDEPFAGVTDDFVEFIVGRIERMSKQHNVVVVTNDHIHVLTKMARNTISVSAVDRSVVTVNEMEQVNRQSVKLTLTKGDDFVVQSTNEDFKFFLDVEILSNRSLLSVCIVSVLYMALFIVTFWNSETNLSALVLIAATLVSIISINPYLASLVAWRNAMIDETEALMHFSKHMNGGLKVSLTLLLVLIISLAEFGVVNAVLKDGVKDIGICVGIITDLLSITLLLIVLAVFTNWQFQMVQIFGGLPNLFMIFFSSTFSPASGFEGVKELRYLFPRFYLWCILPGVQHFMEGCPSNSQWSLLYMIMTAFLGVFVYLSCRFLVLLQRHCGCKWHVHNKPPSRGKEIQEKSEQELSSLRGLFYRDQSQRQEIPSDRRTSCQ